MWNQTIVDWSKRKVAWWYMRRGLEEDVPPLVDEIKLKVLVLKENCGGENSGGHWASLLDEMHLLECKRRKVLTSWRQSKRWGHSITTRRNVSGGGSYGYINDSYYCGS